jgi:hypothetical protein
MKAEHEGKFASPERALQRSIVDTTKLAIPSEARNLKRLQRVQGFSLGHREIVSSLKELRTFIKKFRDVPPEVREFLGVAATRVHRLCSSGRSFQDGILAEDLRSALKMSAERLNRLVSIANAHGLASIDSDGFSPYVFRLRTPRDEWPILEMLADFCEKEQIDIATFSLHLRFDQLDE